EAEGFYVKAHEQAPDDQWAYAKLVEARLLRFAPEQRDREIQVLLKTSGKENRHLLGVLAKLRSEQGDDSAAAEAWGQRAKRTGDYYARKMEGFALNRAGRLDEAAAVLGPCLLEKPDDLYVFRTYISIQRKRGAVDELRQTLEQGVDRAGARRGAFFGELRKLNTASDTTR